PLDTTNSNHLILISKWSFPFALSSKLRHKTRCKRRVFQYKLMDKEKWEEFSSQCQNNITYHNTPLHSNSTESLEHTWHKLQSSIITAALKTIPNKKFTVRNFHHTFTPKASELHKDLKTIRNIMQQTKYAITHNQNVPSTILTHIQNINLKHQFSIPPTPVNQTDLSNWLTQTKSYWKTLYNARNLENAHHLKQHIQTAINTRCERLLTYPTKMINSILNRHTDPVHFDNIKTQTNILTDPPEVKNYIRSHFSQWTGKNAYNRQIFSTQWQTEYNPKHSVMSEWYDPVLEPIHLEEVINTINNFPNNKACGPSGISYEMLKHAGPQTISAITALLNRCLVSGSIPKQWKNGRIFPISKKSTFDGHLHNTRPISLIEHIKKLYTKILTNRLNSIFSSYNILNPHNYIALPGNSTNIPIHILNNFIEDANCNQKEIWLLSQDMSKAYDSVNIDLFTLSLQRLNMPPHLTTILANLLTSRTNRVITNLGLTSPYEVQDGIDQGETITPLFWRIYYDPLISKISHTYTGYQSSVSWTCNISPLSFDSTQVSTPVLAYMDDTLWIAESQSHLEQILNTASSFYQMANIKVNPQKSTLISNSIHTPFISFLHQNIQCQTPKTPFKFLGCWFSILSKSTTQSKLITQEATQLINTLDTKQITDKQACYIINNVIIPILEYRIHNTVLSHSTCNKILSQYLTVAKHKSKLARSTPNSTMLNHNIYGIKNIWDIQLQYHFSALLLRLNDSHLLGNSTHIRLQQLQNNLWSTTNILQHPNPLIDGPNKYSTTFKTILLLKHLECSIAAHSEILHPFTINLPYTPLESLLNNQPQYLTFKRQLRSKHIMFLEQLTSYDNTTLLAWPHISPRIHNLIRGKKPTWFHILENKILDNTSTRQINTTSLHLSNNNSLSFQTGHFNSKSKPWLISYLDQEIIIGKARRFNHLTNTISITHWKVHTDLSRTSLYPTPDTHCTPCPGCSRNSNRIQNTCTLDISATLSTKFLGRKIY